MIGRIRFDWAGEPCVAELSDDLAWSCDHPSHGAQLVGWFTTLFDPRADLSPARGKPGFKALAEAAEWLDAKVQWLDEPEEGDGERLH